jgi:hypothetical protein
MTFQAVDDHNQFNRLIEKLSQMLSRRSASLPLPQNSQGENQGVFLLLVTVKFGLSIHLNYSRLTLPSPADRQG